MGIKKTKIIFGLSILVLGYQNCSQNKISIDDELKSKTLSSSNLLIENSTADLKLASFTFVCPHIADSSAIPKDLIHTEKLKVVIAEYDYDQDSTRVICEVHDVRRQILDSRSVDLSSCDTIPDQQSANVNLYVVPEDIQSNYEAHKINNDTTPLSLGGYAIKYLYMNTGEQSPACDDSGAPLLVQLSPGKTVVSLTSPTDGVAFDLLGKQAYVNAHDKVQTSWFKNTDSDLYFLVKPNRDGLVLGIDEMFADTTRGPDNKFAKQGFAALEKYDSNRDQLIDDNDIVFEELRLWKDLNLDGIVQENELSTLRDKKVLAIDLRYELRHRETDEYGNQTRYKSVVILEDHSYGVILDLWFRFFHQVPDRQQQAPALPLRAPASFDIPVLMEEMPSSPEIMPPEHEEDSSAPSPLLERSPADIDQQTPESHEEEASSLQHLDSDSTSSAP